MKALLQTNNANAKCCFSATGCVRVKIPEHHPRGFAPKAKRECLGAMVEIQTGSTQKIFDVRVVVFVQSWHAEIAM